MVKSPLPVKESGETQEQWVNRAWSSVDPGDLEWYVYECFPQWDGTDADLERLTSSWLDKNQVLMAYNLT